VVDDHGRGAPLGLGPFPRVSYDVRVDVRKRCEDVIGAAVLPERHGLAGQPFEGPVGPDVDDGIRTEVVAEPLVVCVVLVRMDDVGVVVVGL